MAERSDDTALRALAAFKSGVALCFPPRSKAGFYDVEPVMLFCGCAAKTKDMKTIFVFAAIALGLLAGCASHPPAAPTSGLEATDDFKIEEAVYGYLLEKHPWDSSAYGAIYLETGDDRAAALIKKLPRPILPLKPVSQAKRQPNLAPVDLKTGKPGILLSARAVDPTNGVSEAVGTWDAGAEAKGLYAFVLMEMDGQWTIQSAK